MTNDHLVFLQNGLCDPTTKAVRPFSFFTIPPAYQEFGKFAYDWLLFHHRGRTTEFALGEIGHTRPGLKKALLDGLAPHEKDQRRRRKRGSPPKSRVLPGYSTSLAEFYATEGALKTLLHKTVSPASTADIPRTRRQQLRYVKKMAKALENTIGIVDNDSHQVAAIKRSSREVFEDVSWRLYVSANRIQPHSLRHLTLANSVKL